MAHGSAWCEHDQILDRLGHERHLLELRLVAIELESEALMEECSCSLPEAETAERRAGACDLLDAQHITCVDSAEVELRAGVVSGAGLFADGI